MKIISDKFDKTNNGFNYVYEETVPANTTVILLMPTVSANKRGINGIGWQTNGENVTLYGTLSRYPKDESRAMWQEISVNNEVNKVTSAIKIVNEGPECKVALRVILY